MRTTLIVLSSIITISAALPYIIDILKKKTKPRVVSWFTWGLLAAIGSAASLSDHQWAAGILSLSAAVECFVVVILGLKYGNREFETFDMACQIAALFGISLWLIFNSPAIAVIAVVIIDFIGSLPTIKHAWIRPTEETWITFALSGTGALLAVFAATSTKITALAGPIYILSINIVITSVLLWRRKIVRML